MMELDEIIQKEIRSSLKEAGLETQVIATAPCTYGYACTVRKAQAATA